MRQEKQRAGLEAPASSWGHSRSPALSELTQGSPDSHGNLEGSSSPGASSAVLVLGLVLEVPPGSSHPAFAVIFVDPVPCGIPFCLNVLESLPLKAETGSDTCSELKVTWYMRL